MRRAVLGALVGVVAALLAACGNGSTEAPVSVLDGRPRTPDVAGVVGTVDRRSMEIDGRTYPLSAELESFSTYDGALSSIFERPGHYVHAGLDEDGVVRWVAGIGRPAGNPPQVYFASQATRVRGDVIEFSGGTVLRLAPGVKAPAPGEVEVFIDVETDRIVEVQSLNGVPGG